MIRTFKNIGASDLTLTDFHGKFVAVGEEFDGLSGTEQDLKDSAAIAAQLLAGNLSLYDGYNTYYGLDSVKVVQGASEQVTRDGKRIFTASDRPKDHFRCFAGRGDDMVNHKIGLGPNIHLIADPGQTVTLDINFIDAVYIRDGEITYLDAGFDSHLSVDIICPANTPFPSMNRTGTLDLDSTSGTFVANTNGTGAYQTVPVEISLFRFINNLHLVGTSQNKIESPEPFLLQPIYHMRFTVQADPDLTAPLKAAVTMGLYRRVTL
jgi:hypothetical protein